MTKLLLERVLRVSCFTFIGVLLVLVLTACGPGSGGTGTGPTSYSSTASVTGGSSDGIPPGGAQPGSPPQCTADCTQIDLRLDDGSVELVTGCSRFAFAGAWEIDPNGMAVLPGSLQSHAGGAAVDATLRLQFNGTPEFRPSVTATVIGPAGQVLIGPRALGQVENFQPASPAAGCPP
jgi:hypothetical protein